MTLNQRKIAIARPAPVGGRAAVAQTEIDRLHLATPIELTTRPRAYFGDASCSTAPRSCSGWLPKMSPPADPAWMALLSAMELVPVPVLCVPSEDADAWPNAAARALAPGLAWLPSLRAAGLLRSTPQTAELALPAVEGTGTAVNPAAIARWLRARSQLLPGGGWTVACEQIDELHAARAEAEKQGIWLELLPGSKQHDLWELEAHGPKFDELGAQPSALRFARQHFALAPADLDHLASVVRNSLRCPGTYSHSCELRAREGTGRRGQARWRVLAGVEGRPARAIGVTQEAIEPRPLPTTVAELDCMAIWRLDPASDRLYFNAAAAVLLGVSQREDGVPQHQLLERIHPEDLPQFEASLRQAAQTDQPVDAGIRVRGGDGRWLDLYTRHIARRDSTEQSVALVCVAMEVSERWNPLQRERELRRRLELVTRTAGVGHWTLPLDASAPVWSDQLREIHELGPAEPAPDTQAWFAQWLHPLDSERVRERSLAWLRSSQESFSLELRVLLRSGRVRHLYMHARREGSVGQTTIFGVAVDITELRQAEAAARSAAERVALATHAAGMGTWELELSEDISRWDAQMWRLRGREPRPHPMPEAERMAILHPDDRERIAKAHAAAMASDAPASFEFRVIWPDGQVRWLASRSIVQQQDAHTPKRRIGVNWDITEDRATAAMRQEREIALRENAAKSRFMARMSHELRTPLNAVLGFAQLLNEEISKESPSGQGWQHLRHIQAAGEHLLTLVNDVLDLSGIESGEVRVSMQRVELAPLIHGTLPLLAPLLAEHGVTLDWDRLSFSVLADPTRLRQVLLNLLSNAVKYNRRGGTVRVSARAEGDEVAIAIEDTGFGLDEVQQQGLFEPFNRLGAEASPVKGTGIGLLIARALIERMSGRLLLRSIAGQGSVFEVWLQAQNGENTGSSLGVDKPGVAPRRPAPIAEASTNRARPRHRVLYVEDNAVNALIVSEALARRSDIELFIAVDGLSGIAKARDLRPDLVLLDMQLPDIDGLEVMRQLRGDSATIDVPCVAVSANAMQEDIERALRAGAVDYWPKPLNLPAFRAAIDALLRSPGPA